MQNKNCLLEKVHGVIQKNKAKILEELEDKPLFGAVGGSVALNLANRSSDVDCYIVTQSNTFSKIPKGVITTSIDCSDMKLDFMCLTIEELVKECIEYDKVEHNYPTRFFRKECEMDIIKKTKDVERADFKREMAMRIYLADQRLEFEHGSLKENYEKLKPGLRVLDIWDSHFNRAYGNYTEKIKNQKVVLLRKYLYTISEITICYLLLLRKEKPIMNYEHMFAPPYCPYENNEIVKLCNDLWKENEKSDIEKGKKYIPAILQLNQWIEQQLEELLNKMKEKEDYLRASFLLL